MPPIKTIAKNVCPLCEDITPLLYKYIICKPCHEKIQSTETDTDTEEEIEEDEKEEHKDKQLSH